MERRSGSAERPLAIALNVLRQLRKNHGGQSAEESSVGFIVRARASTLSFQLNSNRKLVVLGMKLGARERETPGGISVALNSA